MLTLVDTLKLADNPNVTFLDQRPFETSWARDHDGIVRRPKPDSIDEPFGPLPISRLIVEHDRIEAPDSFVISIKNGCALGQRAILVGNDYMATDSSHSRHSSAIFMDPSRREFENMPIVGTENGDLKVDETIPVVELAGDVVLLTGMEYGNYGAFLLRLLPKIIQINRLNLKDIRYLAPVAATWQAKILQAFGIDNSKIIPHARNHIYKADNLIVPSMGGAEFFMDDTSSALFQSFATFLRSTEGSIQRPELLYVSRIAQGIRNPYHRRMLNESELVEVVTALGFHVFEPEGHSFSEQVKTFAAARVVVGPGGAGMFNTIFSPPSTRILSIEPMQDWVGLHANMFASFRHRYNFILGGADPTDPTAQKRWNGDLACIEKRIKAII